MKDFRIPVRFPAYREADMMEGVCAIWDPSKDHTSQSGAVWMPEVLNSNTARDGATDKGFNEHLASLRDVRTMLQEGNCNGSEEEHGLQESPLVCLHAS